MTDLPVVTEIALWWLAFAGTHVVGSSFRVRSWAISRLGLPVFKAAYSVVALVTFVPLVTVFWSNRHAGTYLFDPPATLLWIAQALMLVATTSLALGVAAPSPMTTVSEMTGRFTGSARGIQRITRHPLNLAFGLFGFAHMLVSPTLGDQVFFGGFLVFSLLSAWHQDHRTLKGGAPEMRAFHAETSYWPFVAIVQGRQRFRADFGVVPVLAGVVLFVALRLVHPSWIGGFSS